MKSRKIIHRHVVAPVIVSSVGGVGGVGGVSGCE